MIRTSRSVVWLLSLSSALIGVIGLSTKPANAQLPELKGFDGIFDSGKVDPKDEPVRENPFEAPKSKPNKPTPKKTQSGDNSSEKPRSKPTQGKVIDLQKDLNEAHQLATLEGRPLLAIFGADWCTWCRKMELELQDEQADNILKSWVVVKIDADRSPDLAEKMNVSALPALRVLDFQLNQIAAREGYQPIDQLEKWLDEKYSAANPVVGQVLFGTGQLSADDVEQLVSLLADRSPKIRTAAQARLTAYPGRTAKSVVAVFEKGKLSQQLASQQILKSWKAPVDAVDPWNPASFTSDNRDLLNRWLAELPTEKLSEQADSKSPVSTDTTQVQVTLEELLRASNNQTLANMELSPAIVPAINQALEAENLTDAQRQMLRELKYNALASPNTRLAQSALLKGLASLNSDTHRKAAEKLFAQLTEKDSNLVDELSGDLDSIVRELSVPVIEKLNLLSNGPRVTRLLQDKSPSVRTAVLRSLSQRANGEAVDALLSYIDQESDEDLLVFAAKTLGKLKLKKARESMLKLIKHSSWRVRAATIDAIAESIEGRGGMSGTSSGLSDDLVEGVLLALQDSDSFVVHRSTSLLPKVIDSRNVAKFVDVLIKNPAAAEALIQGESYGESDRGKALADAAAKLTNSADTQQRIGAIRLTARLAPERLVGRSEVLNKMLDEAGESRAVALEATIATLGALRDQVLKYDQENSASYQARFDNQVTPKLQTEPWHPVPESLRTLPSPEKKKLFPVKPGKEGSKDGSSDGSSGNASVAAESSDSSSKPAKSDELDDVLGSIFGDKPKIAMQESAKVEGPATTVQTPASGLDSVDSFFGASDKQDSSRPPASSGSKPATSAPQPVPSIPAQATDPLFGDSRTADNVGSEAEDLFEEMPKTPQAKRRIQRAREDKKNPNYGLTSFRINQYFSEGPAAFDVVPDGATKAINAKDLAELTKLTKKILGMQSQASQAPQPSDTFLDIAAVVCGNQEIAQQVVVRLVQKIAQGQDEKEARLQLKQVLPWANATVRLYALRKLTPDFSSLNSKQDELLDRATFVDDYEVASWLIEESEKLSERFSNQDFSEREATSWNQMGKYVQRSLFGTKHSTDDRWSYGAFSGGYGMGGYGMGAHVLPNGTVQSIRWMNKAYQATESVRVKTMLLANLSFVDTDTAKETAVGYLAQATVNESPLTEVAIELALSEADPLTVDRAVQWLDHPLRLVRLAALERLTTLDEDDSSRPPMGVRVKRRSSYSSPDSFALAMVTREITAETMANLVAEFASSKETDKVEPSSYRHQVMALQLLANPQFSIDDCIDLSVEIKSRTLISAILVKVDRKDDAAKEFFAKTVELFNKQTTFSNEQRNSLKVFYDSLKKLRGAEYAKLRTDLRKRYSTILDN